MAVSGPEVIEAAKGVEEFDARDRALVWRTMGGKHRFLMGDVDAIVPDDVAAFRHAAISRLGVSEPLSLENMDEEHASLKQRLSLVSEDADAMDVWTALGIADASAVPLSDITAFLEMAEVTRKNHHA